MTNRECRLLHKTSSVAKLHFCFVAPTAYHVLFDSDSGVCGGAEVQQYLLAKALVDKGHRATIVVQDFRGMRTHDVRHGIEIVKGPFRYLGGANAYFLADSLKLIALLRKVDADFYLLKCPRALLFAMSVHRRIFGKRLVKWFAGDSDCSSHGWSPSDWLYMLGIRATDCFIFQSGSQKALAEQKLGVQGTVVPSIAHAHEGAAVRMSKDIDVLWVGSCTPNKQPEIILDLAQSAPDIEYSILMSQGSCSPYGREIERRARGLKNVRYEGFVPYSQSARFYRRARVLACTSRQEGFPNTFLQAWQEGVPVVSLTVDPDNVITSHHLGKVSGDIEQMRLDIGCLVNDEEYRQQLGTNGEKYVQQHHSKEIIVDQFLAALNRLS
jgi:glycosyltransferase involved in cell wall biosynthesis